jgi:MSHA biogenesis protein MshP
MYPKEIQSSSIRHVGYRSKQHGLGLVSAIFVITVLAVIIAGMARFFAVSQDVTVQEFLGARAITAAQTGVELELTCLENGFAGCTASAAVGSLPSSWDYWPGPASSASFSMTGLKECRAEVFYYTVSSSEGSFWTIDSTGFCGGSGLNGASRRVVIRAAQ